MNCENVKENLSAYIDKVLNEDEMASIEAHIANCPECHDEHKALQETIHMLSSLEEIIPPASFRRELRTKLEGKKEKKRFSINALIPNWLKRMNRTQLMPIAVALVLMIVILPFVGQNMFRAGSSAQKAESPAELAGSSSSYNVAMDQALTAEEDMRMKAAPEGRGMATPAETPQALEKMNGFSSSPGGGQDASATAVVEIDRKIIKNADVTIQVDDYNVAAEDIKQKVALMGGYVANENVNVVGREGIKHGYLQVRIPSVHFDSFLSGMEDLGQVRNRNIYTQDVTEEYVDVESRLKTLRTKEERLLAILTKSGELSDILAVENELANTRAQLESLQGRLRYLDNRTDYSLLNINIQQAPASTQQISNPGLKDILKKTREAFIQSINSILIGLGNLVVFTGSALPKLILIVLAVVIIWWWLRKRRG